MAPCEKWYAAAVEKNSSSISPSAYNRVARHTGDTMNDFFCKLWAHDEGQDIAEYAVMLAVILVIVVGTIRLIGSNANNVFSNAASSLQ